MPILVVEGNDHVRDVISAILEISGYEAVMASSGMEALHTLRRRRDFVLALVDVTEPTLDGWDLCRTVLATPELAGVPLVMMTGAIPPTGATPPGGLPASALLKKPFGMHDLLETVRKRAVVRPTKKVRKSRAPAGAAIRSRRRVMG